MPQNFGELSFRKGSSTVVGLPLDVIDKVGANLTEHYTRNRQAVSKIKESVLNLPDANSEKNKEIIARLSSEIKDSFSKYAEEGNWWEADDAVYNAADKLSSSQEVKDLIKYSGQAAKVDDQIEKSDWAESDKQTRRAMNQAMNQGIRDKDGKALSYQGRGLSETGDITTFYKKYDDLIKGFEADVKSYNTNPSTFNMDTASDGFKQGVMQYGSSKITTVDKAEVSKYLMDIVAQDSKFKATVNDIAELELFRNTGKLRADRNDVMNVLDTKAATNPALENIMIYSSKSFQSDTAKMSDKEKASFVDKIKSSPDLRSKYYSEGKEDYLKMNETSNANNLPGLYDQIYKGTYMSNAVKGINGIADKYSYVRSESDMKYMFDPLSGKRYEAYLKNMGAHTMVTYDGNINAANLGDYITTRDKLNTDISALKGELSGNLSTEQKEIKTKLLNNLETQRNTNDYILEAFKQNLGMSDKDIYDKNKKSLIEQTGHLLASYHTPMDLFSIRGIKSTLPKNAPSDIYDIVTSKPNASNSELLADMKAKGINVSEKYISAIRDTYTKSYKDDMDNLLKTRGIDVVSLPVATIGNIGASSLAYQTAMSQIGEKFQMGSGEFEILAAPKDDDLKVGGTNIGRQSTFVHPTKKVGGKFPIKVSLATIKNDSPYNTGEMLLRIEETNPLDGTSKSYLTRYKGSGIIGNQALNEIFVNSAKSASMPNNPNAQTDIESGRFVAGILGGSLPVKTIAGKDMSGLSMSGATSKLKPAVGSVYEDMIVDLNGSDLRITTIQEDDGTFTQDIFNSTGQRVIPTIYNGTTPGAVNQYLGAVQSLQTYGLESPTGQQIMRMFQLNNNK